MKKNKNKTTRKINSPPTPTITAIFIGQCVIKIEILLDFLFRNSYLNEN